MGISYVDTIERMKSAGKLKNDSRVARVLSVTPQALSNYKKRGKIPADLLIRFSEKYGLYVDWLINGEGPMYRAGYGPGEDASVVASAREEVRAYGDLAKTASMAPDEMISIGKLLKILRKSDDNTKALINKVLDAFWQQTENLK